MLPRTLRRLASNHSIDPIRKLTSSSLYTEIKLDQITHDIQITGRLIRVYREPEGTISIYIRSIADTNRNVALNIYNSDTHRAFISRKNRDALDLFHDDNSIGREICVEGKLYTFPFHANASKDQSNSEQYKSDRIGLSFLKCSISVQKVYFCRAANVTDAEASGDAKIWNRDENRVDIIGYSVSHIIKGDNYRAFTICVERNPQREENEPTRSVYSRIVVLDERLFPLLDARGDKPNDEHQQYYIHGELAYNSTTDDRFAECGSYVLAHGIYCIKQNVLNLS